MKTLPYRAVTRSGDVIDVRFPLHNETGDPVRVSQLVTVVLEALSRDIEIVGETSNGDVMQALAMALAVRAGMVHGSHPVAAKLAHDLLNSAQNAVAEAERYSPPSGRA